MSRHHSPLPAPSPHRDEVPPALLKRPVKNPKIIRQRGKDTIKLKFTKCEERTWGPAFEGYDGIYGEKTKAQQLRESMEKKLAHDRRTANNPRD